MGEQADIVADTNVLLNLILTIVDGRDRAPTGEDPLKTLLSTYDFHVPGSVLGEISDAAQGDDLLAAAASLVLDAADHVLCNVANRGFLSVPYVESR